MFKIQSQTTFKTYNTKMLRNIRKCSVKTTILFNVQLEIVENHQIWPFCFFKINLPNMEK